MPPAGRRPVTDIALQGTAIEVAEAPTRAEVLRRLRLGDALFRTLTRTAAIAVLLLSFPIAVASAIYLEEFAHKNRWTDLIEVNINPNIDAGNEDQVLGEALYREVLGVFARRIAETTGGAAQRPAP